MEFFNTLVLSLTFLLFPISIYLVFLAYRNNFTLKEQKIVFAISLLSSLYLMIKFRDCNDVHYLLLVNVPLLVSFLKRRKYLSIIISIVITIYYNLVFDLNIYFMIAEYAVYYITYYYLIKEKLTSDLIINSFILIKGVVVSFEMCYLFGNSTSFINIFSEVFALIVFFYMLSFLMLKLLEKGEQIINLNSILKELEKEKVLRSSLFKITHEIKNPISVCKGYLNMMDYNDINKVQKYNQKIENEINRTLAIMDDFLDYTKIKVNLDVMDITMLIEDTLESIIGLFEHFKVKLVKDVPNQEIYINGDYDRLKQVFVNIIKNSIEAIENSGVINFKIKTTPNKVVIIIKDNGKGMDNDTLMNVMEPFFTTKTKGTGLGVSLSKEIICLHSGTIKYESIVGKGTAVTIKLPLKKIN